MARSAAIALVAAGLCAAWPASAPATHPGRNGLLAASAEVLGSETSTIYLGRRDGGGLRALRSPCQPGPLTPQTRCHAVTPSWSPDGTMLAFSVLSATGTQIYVVRADGSDLRLVPGARGYSPSWSPDGRRLAFSADDPSGECGRRHIHAIGVDGSGLRRLTSRGGDHPDWSARGEIAFSRLRLEADASTGEECWRPRAVAAVRPDGSGPRLIVRRGIDPSWAPRGYALAFQRGNAIHRVRSGGRGERRLSVRRGFLEGPAWSPDGRLIAFRDGRRTRAVNARTGRPVRVGFDPPGTAYSPAWQPRPR